MIRLVILLIAITGTNILSAQKYTAKVHEVSFIASYQFGRTPELLSKEAHVDINDSLSLTELVKYMDEDTNLRLQKECTSLDVRVLVEVYLHGNIIYSLALDNVGLLKYQGRAYRRSLKLNAIIEAMIKQKFMDCLGECCD